MAVNTLTHVVRDAAPVFILVVGSMMILSEIGIDLKPLLAAAGLSSLAIGCGAQSLAKDVISGFLILLGNSGLLLLPVPRGCGLPG